MTVLIYNHIISNNKFIVFNFLQTFSVVTVQIQLVSSASDVKTTFELRSSSEYELFNIPYVILSKVYLKK